MFFDRYCAITGWTFVTAEDEFRDFISGTYGGNYQWGSEEEIDPEYYEDYSKSEKRRQVPSKAVQEGLKYTRADIEAINKYVLVTPYKVNKGGEVVVPEEVTKPERLDEKTITYVFDVWPDTYPENGFYLGLEGHSYAGVGVNRILINFCAFLILQHLIPGLKAHVFYELVLVLGGKCCHPLPNVDYGPMQRAQGRFMDPGMIADFDFDSDVWDGSRDANNFGLEKQWLRLLTQEGKSDEEILEDAWMGRGNMWVFKHPGIFPVAEADRLVKKHLRIQLVTLSGGSMGRSKALKVNPLLALPPELTETIFYYLCPDSILRFISTNRVTYGRFRAHLDKLTYIWIRQERPWYLPVGPIQCKEGDTEIVRWRDGWQEVANSGGEGSEKGEEIPWFAYHLACKRSPNMKSRERIWKIVLQIKEILASTSLTVA